jgi:hypothetical protein
MSELGVLFNKIQNSTVAPRKYFQRAEALLVNDPDQFIEDLLCFLPRCLSVPKQESSIERLLQFITKFASSTTTQVTRDGEKIPFCCFLLEQTATFTTVADKTIRGRSCQFIGDLLRSLPETCDLRYQFELSPSYKISDDIWRTLQAALVARTIDKIVSVRVAAVNALERLQTAEEEDDFVVQAMCRVLKSDPSKYGAKNMLANHAEKYGNRSLGLSFYRPAL